MATVSIYTLLILGAALATLASSAPASQDASQAVPATKEDLKTSNTYGFGYAAPYGGYYGGYGHPGFPGYGHAIGGGFGYGRYGYGYPGHGYGYSGFFGGYPGYFTG